MWLQMFTGVEAVLNLLPSANSFTPAPEQDEVGISINSILFVYWLVKHNFSIYKIKNRHLVHSMSKLYYGMKLKTILAVENVP